MENMAGGDHFPVYPAWRHDIGPRPPVPPMPTANFFTLGRIMMQSALAKTLGGMSLLASMACKTVAALRMVSSSSALLAPHTGRVTSSRTRDTSKHGTAFLVRSIAIQSSVEWQIVWVFSAHPEGKEVASAPYHCSAECESALWRRAAVRPLDKASPKYQWYGCTREAWVATTSRLTSLALRSARRLRHLPSPFILNVCPMSDDRQ